MIFDGWMDDKKMEENGNKIKHVRHSLYHAFG